MLEASGLIGIMHQQSRLVADLENLIKEQLQALQQDDLNKITAVTNQQEYIGRRIAELEEQRLRMMEDYSRMTGFEMKHFHDLQQQVTQRDWHELQTLREEITNSSQAIKGINELNALLLKQGLKYAERMLHILHPIKHEFMANQVI
jgi:flagellar biosynthesis/type III secretory pathway chaperone